MKDGKNRVSRMITRTGDSGETGLADGSRLPKHDIRIELIGALDELNSAIGYLVSLKPGESYLAMLAGMQQALFDLGAEAALPNTTHLKDDAVAQLEAACMQIKETLPPLREFVIPGGTQAAAWGHICRTTTRRCERCLVAVASQYSVNPNSLAYLNRLSDFFFMLSRHINLADQQTEPMWRGTDPA